MLGGVGAQAPRRSPVIPKSEERAVKAIMRDVYGSADVVQLRETPRPTPAPGQVLLRVHAAGVGPDVWHLMTGQPFLVHLGFGLRRPRNPVLGWDVAGRVEEVGGNVTGLKVGDAVFGVCDGSFAEYACAKPDKLAPKPGNLTFGQAAALPVSGVTAFQALHTKARLRPGQRVLVVGASGGVGSLAVQLATAHGADVTAVCGPTAADFVRSLGATDVIDYTTEEITARSRRHDVVLDIAGSRSVSLLRRPLAPNGTLVHVGGEGGSRWFGDLGTQLRMATLSPFQGQKLRGMVAVTRRGDLLALKELAETGALAPVVDSSYPLPEAPAALRHLEQGHPRGKIVLSVIPDA